MMGNYTPLEDLVDIEQITHEALWRLYDASMSAWANVIFTIDAAFAALIDEIELKRRELSYADINNLPSLQASHQICRKILGDQLRKALPLAAETDKFLRLKIWGKVRTPSGHVEYEEPYRFKRIHAEPDELDRKIQAEMLRRGIKWP